MINKNYLSHNLKKITLLRSNKIVLNLNEITGDEEFEFEALLCNNCLNYYHDFYKIYFCNGYWLYDINNDGDLIDVLSCDEEIIKQLLE